jgi:hypothetical protein
MGSRHDATGGVISFRKLISKTPEKMSFNEIAAALGLVLEDLNPGILNTVLSCLPLLCSCWSLKHALTPKLLNVLDFL